MGKFPLCFVCLSQDPCPTYVAATLMTGGLPVFKGGICTSFRCDIQHCITWRIEGEYHQTTKFTHINHTPLGVVNITIADLVEDKMRRKYNEPYNV